ncbi:MAG: hypothetical protein D6708_09810, partial [Candidatus Dadabacteria bacterium]
MAAKKNESLDEIDVALYDWVGKGVLNPSAKIKVPACGWCHPGGGPGEYARDPDTGLVSDKRYDEIEADALAAADAGGYVDGDFSTIVAGGGPSHWRESGVAEADCLLCHFGRSDKYNFGARNKQLTYRNYKWAATVGARMGSVAGKVYDFDESVKTGFMSGTWTGVTPTVTYDVSEDSVLKEEAGKLLLRGEIVAERPSYNYCLFCHEGSDTKKRGFEWSGEHDVHAGAGFHCLGCHGLYDADGDGDVREHQIGKGYARLGSVRNDLDGTMRHDCVACHLEGGYEGAEDPTAAHEAAFGIAGFHLERIACEGCHVPYIDWNQGALIDMSSGNQIWTLSDGTTPTWAGDFQKAGRFVPFLKKYDPDGSGPLPEKYYPFGAKSSAWFGDLKENGEVQPIFLRFVKSAYESVKDQMVSPTVRVLTVPDHLAGETGLTDTQKPSVSDPADIKLMIETLREMGFENPVFVTGVVRGLDENGDLVVLEGVHAESDHNFSINHDIRPAEDALGAGGCTDCHTGTTDEEALRAARALAAGVPAAWDSPLYNPQVREVTDYLANRTQPVDPDLLADPAIAETMVEAAGFDEETGARLLAAVDPDDPASVHAAIADYAEQGANAC